jgi:hypothetical protein
LSLKTCMQACRPFPSCSSSERQPFQPIPQAAKPGRASGFQAGHTELQGLPGPRLVTTSQHQLSRASSLFRPVAAFADRTNIGSALSVCPGLRPALLATSPTLPFPRCHPDR